MTGRQAAVKRLFAALAVCAALIPGARGADGVPETLIETPDLASRVEAGLLPPVGERLPDPPAVAQLSGDGIGRHGGELHTLMGGSSDTKRLVVYGYARLVRYDRNFEIVPDLLQSVEVEDDRVFTLHLRKGHRWSDGHPFTAEDFRYYWEDFATDPKVSKSGPPVILRVDGELPKFEVL